MNAIFSEDGDYAITTNSFLVCQHGGVNALIYLARDDKVNAALSGGAMIPFAGWLSTGGKFVNKAIKYVDEVVDVGKSVVKHADDVVEGIGDVAKNADEITEGAIGLIGKIMKIF